MSSLEINFDGLVGQTHNYAGLSSGNVASTLHAKELSYPKDAAKQGLAKMKALKEMGLEQGVLAPQQRPDVQLLRRLGFTGTEQQIIEKAFRSDPFLLNACYSASSMWTANAATISPSSDTADGKVHITPANLVNKLHRSIESNVTGRILKATFSDSNIFTHHQSLPHGDFFGDEGAANHTRFCHDYGKKGVEFFVYGKSYFDPSRPRPKKFDARQSLEASKSIARLHQLDEGMTVFAQQNPDVIDQGVFHNDVIGVGNKNVYFYHEQSFLHKDKTLSELNLAFGGDGLELVEVKSVDVPVQDAVTSYLFNSQLISLPNEEVVLLAPKECEKNSQVFNYIQNVLIKETCIKKVLYYDLSQSMKNGGGPACLRLRVAVKKAEVSGINPKTLLTDSLYQELDAWIDKHYRDQLSHDDLRDPELLTEVRTALDQLTQILNLGSIYPFQI